MIKHLNILSNILITASSKKKRLEDEHGTDRVSPTLHIQLHKDEAKAILKEINTLREFGYLTKEYPNDAELGAEMRKLINEK